MDFLKCVLPYFSPLVSPDWTIWPNQQYGASAQEVADLYLLNHGVHPCIVFIHGGGWSQGDKSAYEGRARKYALAGFHVVSINYRLASFNDPSTQWNAALLDCQAAIRWLRQNCVPFRIDPYRMAAGGDSAGGHLALMLGIHRVDVPALSGVIDRQFIAPGNSPWVQCVLDMFGPTDLTVPDPFRNLLETIPLFGGKTYAQAPDLYMDASPLWKVDNKMPPTIIFHGTSDTVVPYAQSFAMATKLQQLGVHCDFETFNGGHEFDKLSTFDQIAVEMKGLDFVSHVLRP